MSLISTIVLLLLVAAWGWVLGRPLLQSMLNRSQRDPVGHFNRQLSVLGNAPRQSAAFAGPIAAGPSRSMKRRRLQWFMALVMAAVVSLLLGLVLGGIFWWQHLLLDVLLVGYVALAARIGAAERERANKVTSLRLVGAEESSVRHLRAVGER